MSTDDVGRRRRNGWNWPLHPFQICSWIMLSSLAIGAFISVMPLPVYPSFQIIFSCAILWIFICMIYVTSTDPGTEHKDIVPVKFDHTKNTHVIENGFCNICQINVQEGTKHCRSCNKCIPHFDHHCKWLNNCIGHKNYKLFINLVSSLCLFSLGCFLFFGWALVNFVVLTTPDKPVPELFVKKRLLVDIWNWFVLTVVIVIMFGVTVISTLHLLTFHIMLFFNNQTTFSYIVGRRKKQKKDNVVDNLDPTQNSCKSLPLTNAVYSIYSTPPQSQSVNSKRHSTGLKT